MAEHLLGLIGPARSGKDTVASILADQGWERVAFADPLRTILERLDPYIGGRTRLSDALSKTHYGSWDAAKDRLPEVRRLQRQLGTEGGRDVFGEDVWVNLALEKADQTDAPVVVTDVRFENELDAIRRAGGTVAAVVRPGFDAEPEAHASEVLSARASDVADVTIVNDDTIATLQERVLSLAEGLGQRSVLPEVDDAASADGAADLADVDAD